jgi:hypothetical protein
MHRPGSNPDHMTAEDFLCDFCLHHWTPDRPMVEGHRGSLLCGECLTMAYVLAKSPHAPTATEDAACILCLQHKPGPHGLGPRADGPIVCAECIEQAARKLEKDKDCDWRRPVA